MLGITVAGGVIPGFRSSVTSYAVSVGYTVEQVTITPTTNDANATVTYLDGDDMSLADANTTDGQQMDLAVGNTIIKVKVTAEDTVATRTYAITITRTEEDTSLSPPASDPAAAFPSTAVYSVTFQGSWTNAVTPDGVPASAHFSRLIGSVHSDAVTFLESGEMASSGVESMAEVGGTSALRSEVQVAINATPQTALSVLKGDTDFIGPQVSKTLSNVELTTAFPRVTLTTMVAPSHDWFVGVSGLSLLDSQGRWLRSYEADLFPWDAGTEEGTDFALDPSVATNPRGDITSIRGTGKFSTERIATLTFTLQSVSTTRSVAENTEAGTDIGASVVTTNASGTITYTLGGTDAASFNIVGSTGQLQTKATLDYESKRSYAVIVTATDANGSTSVMITINVSDINETEDPRLSVETIVSNLILVLRAGGDFVAVPAGAATTAADLFGGTDVTRVWKYNRLTRAWDLSYRPRLGSGGFAIEPGDILWVVTPRAQTVGG